jgi:hypothetical protein
MFFFLSFKVLFKESHVKFVLQRRGGFPKCTMTLVFEACIKLNNKKLEDC